MINKNFEFTQNLQELKKLNVPCTFADAYPPDYIYDSFKIPTNIELGKTYYKLDGNNLIAFRILAFSFGDTFEKGNCGRIISNTYMYVQYPNETPKWEKLNYNMTLFPSKEDYSLYMLDPKNKFEIEYNYLKFIIPNTTYDYIYVWYRGGCYNHRAKIKHILYTPNGFFIGIFDNDFILYNDKADCIANNINKVNVIDFEDTQTPSLDIRIDVVKSQITQFRLTEI